MAFRKCTAFIDAPCRIKEPPNLPCDGQARAPFEEQNVAVDNTLSTDVNIDLREVYFLIMHFLSAGPCQRTVEQLWNEVMVHQLLPRRYHAWYSRSSAASGDNKNDDVSFPLSYNKLVERYPHIGKDHLVKLLKQLLLTASPSLDIMAGRIAPRNVATLFGAGSFSLLDSERNEINKQVNSFPSYLRWPHIQADQVHGLNLRAIGGFRKHHRAPSIRLACYTIIRPSTMVQKMQNIKRLRGHRNAVYCAIIDRTGRYVITGSDDRLVKIWSMESAFCLASCRGHEGDITDLAVSSNNFFVASASNDFSIRVMPNGFPISVLRGHSGAVTAIAFSPRTSTSHHLLSSSDDGTCRIWNARSSECLSIYVPKPSSDISSLGNGNGPCPSNVPSSSHAPLSHQIICCAFNANGSYFVTGSSDTRARVWSTGKSSTDDHEQPMHEIDVLEGHENDVNYVQFSACAVAQRYLSPNSLPEENRQRFKNSWFNPDNIVTCSRDGSAIIWVPVSRKSHGKARKWRKSYHLKVPPPPMAPQPSRGGPRQRRLPTPRGVNMIVWSLDDRFVLAAIMDCRICVWNAKDGTLVHSLTGHSESTYVLDVHPFDPRIAMSAGYDGKTIIWDIWEGKPIRIYEIGRYKLVDGRFSQDGTSIVLSDDAGQIYLLSTGQGESQKDAKYDQFFLGDYRPLTQVPGENVLDQETGLTPYSRNIRDPLCDSTMMPYPEPYQSMYQRRRLSELGKEWNASSMKLIMSATSGLGQEMLPLADLDRVAEPLPEFIDAMYWEPDVEVINDETDSEYNVTDEYCSEGEIASVNSSSCSDPEYSSEDDAAKRGYEDGLRRSKRGKQKAGAKSTVSSGNRLKRKSLDENGSTSSRTKKAKTRSSGRRTSRTSLRSKSLVPQRKSQSRAASSEDEDEDDSELFSSETERSLRDSNRQSKIPVIRLKYLQDESTSLNRSEDVVKPSEPAASQSNVGNNKRLLLKIPVGKFTKSVTSSSKLASSSSSPTRVTTKGDGLISENPGSSTEVTNTELSEKHAGADFRVTEHEVGGQSTTTLGCGGGEIRWGDVKIRTSKPLKSGAELKENQACRRLKFKIKTNVSRNPESSFQREINGQVDASTSAGGAMLLEKNEDGERPSILSRCNSDSSRTFNVAGYRGEASKAQTDAMHTSRSVGLNSNYREAGVVSHDYNRLGGTPSIDMMSASRYSGNKGAYVDSDESSLAGKTSWLSQPQQEEGYRYIPQLGDEVVYLRQGHQQYLLEHQQGYSERRRNPEPGPWSSIKKTIGAVEFCSVEQLDYSVDQSGDPCCKMKLKFTDPLSDAFGYEFNLTLTDLSNFTDFLVERTQFNAAMEQNWTVGDKCHVWWRDEDGNGGKWWGGQIVSSKDKSSDFPGSPWERYSVDYKNDPGDYKHSPWELHDLESRWEQPHIDDEIRERLISFFSQLHESVSRNKDPYGISRLNEVAKKNDFTNLFPAPFSPQLIKMRLKSNYYRSMAAFYSDIDVMMSNAKAFFGKNAEVGSKMKRLSELFNTEFSKLG